MMYAIAPILALAGAAAASYQDVKTKEISNALTLPLIAVGLLFYAMRTYEEKNAVLVIPLAATYTIIWMLWRAGMWGGGDAKLVMGICALVPPYHGMMFIPLFFIMMAAVAMVHYVVFGLMEEMRRGRARQFVLALALMAAASSIAYLVADMVFPPLSPVALLAAFFVSADLMSSHLSCIKTVPVSEELLGEPLAETIGLRNGRVIRREREMSLIRRMLKRRNEHMDEVLVAPSHLGLSKEDVTLLKKCCGEVKVMVTYPMAPLILVALALSLAAEWAGLGDMAVWHL